MPTSETASITLVERQYGFLVGQVSWDRLPRENERWYVLRGGERVSDVRLRHGHVNRGVPGPTFALWIWDRAPSSLLADILDAREELVFANDEGKVLRGSHYEPRGEWSVFSTDIDMPAEMPSRIRLITPQGTLELDAPEHAMARKGFCIPPNRKVEELVRSTLSAGATCIVSLE